MIRIAQNLVILLLFFALFEARAEQSSTSLSTKKKALSSAQETLDLEWEQKKALIEKMDTLSLDLQETKETLIETASLIRENETNLADIQARITRLEQSKKTMEDKLKKDRGSVARLVLALHRIRNSPPEAMLARPQSPYKTAQSALLMAQLIPAIERHTQALRKNLETLENVSKDLLKEKHNHLKLSQSLKAQQQTLFTLMDTRENIFRQTSADIQIREANIEKISLKAQNLEDLVSKLKEQEQRERAQIEDKERQKTQEEENRLTAYSERLALKQHSAKPAGAAQLPISGAITVNYKQKDDLGAPSNGLTIEGRSEALVVAPLDGKIQFAGPFKKYGNIVIIEHDDGYHSLVAGLKKIDTVVGERVTAGEPIGILPTVPSGLGPKLYYELRHNGKPVNPSQKFFKNG